MIARKAGLKYVLVTCTSARYIRCQSLHGRLYAGIVLHHKGVHRSMCRSPLPRIGHHRRVTTNVVYVCTKVNQQMQSCAMIPSGYIVATVPTVSRCAFKPQPLPTTSSQRLIAVPSGVLCSGEGSKCHDTIWPCCPLQNLQCKNKWFGWGTCRKR